MSHRTLVVIVAFAAIFSLDLARETDIDFWWHLRTGQVIAETGAIPHTDPFSYTAQGRSWTAHEWLWELVAYRLYGLGGYRLLVVLSALVVTIAYAVLYRLMRRLGTNEIASTAVVLWAAALGLPNLGVRPRELTHLFFAIFLALTFPTGAKAQRLWILPVCMLLWVNLHGAFVLGIILVGLTAAGQALDAWRSHTRPALSLLVAGVATVVATAVNPWGIGMLAYPFRYYTGGENPSFALVTEFQSPDFHEPMTMVFLAGLLLFILLRVGRALSYVETLLSLTFLFEALVSGREVSICAMVLTPMIAVGLRDSSRLARALPPSRLPPIFSRMNWIVLGLLAVAGGAALAAKPDLRARLQLRSEPNEKGMPIAGARFIEEHGLLKAPLFNYQPWGGYLIYRWYPDRRVFIDGRIDMFGPEICNDYVEVANVRRRWSEVLAKYGIGTVLTDRHSPLSVLLAEAPQWERVFEGEIEEVFIARDGSNLETARSAE